MDFILKSKGVFELTKKEVLGVYYANKKEWDDKVIVSYFESKESGIVIKTILEDHNNTDNLYITFSDDSATDREFYEAIILGINMELNESRNKLIRRTENKNLKVQLNYKKYMDDNRLEEAFKKNIDPNELGYEIPEYWYLIPGYASEYQQKMILTEAEELKIRTSNIRLYEQNRDDYINWDEYFLASAILTSMRSKDPSTQVGCCIVNDSNIKLSEGYNGAPAGWEDSKFPWAREGENNETKYPYVVHSEANAITHCIGQGINLNSSRIYVSLFPCSKCALLIVQSGIKEVIYLSDKYNETEDNIAAKRIFDTCGINYRQLVPDKELTLKLKL